MRKQWKPKPAKVDQSWAQAFAAWRKDKEYAERARAAMLEAGRRAQQAEAR